MKYLLLLILLIPGIASAQKCNEVKDDFTGKVTTSSVVVLEGSLASALFSNTLVFTKVDTTRMAGVIFMLGSVNDAIKKENLSLLVKFADGEILKMPTNKHSTINTTTAGMRQGMQIVFSSDVTAELIAKFAAKPIEKIRLGFHDDNGYDIEIKGSKAKSIMTAVACIR